MKTKYDNVKTDFEQAYFDMYKGVAFLLINEYGSQRDMLERWDNFRRNFP
jgi:hypothetical protein